jgi:endonuclease/exonuclease/phosphatase family metal-dependent hydrolase
MSPSQRAAAAFAVLVALGAPSRAQWSPATGQWGKVDPADVRVMTYNVEDGLCSSNDKVENNGDWCALARVVAALKPDVLVLLECGDNTGNGTGSGVDSVATLNTVLGMFLHGGVDSFNGNTPITAWVQKYAPSYDLPYRYVSSESDGFNRNCILSRFPFADLNGDTRSTIADVPNVSAGSAWAPGGDGGIRGFGFAELDLPGATYLGNLVTGFAHLKAGGAPSDHDQRIDAAQNVAYFVRYGLNGNGGGVPDPLGRIADSPAMTSVLDVRTPVVLAGDWNEDEWTNGTRGPADWLTQAQTVGGTTDGTDRDGSDMTFDSATHFSTGSDASHSSGAKYDYVAWQESVATLRLQSIFISGSNPAGSQPPECVGFAGGVSSVTSAASDHRPVFVDLRLPVVDCNGNAVADTTDIATGTSADANGNLVPDECDAVGAPYCFGNGSEPGLTPCPCGNVGAAGRGCANSVSAAGALLAATGTTSPDTVELSASSMPAVASAIFLKGDLRSTTGYVFGDGVRCADGNLIRLGTLVSVAGAASYPGPGQQLVSVRGATPPGSGLTGHYQTYYRNAAGTFCPPETFNVSNALQITW